MAFMRMNRIHAHCCCRQKSLPCKDAKGCPGTQAVKFNLLEKKAAPTVRLNPAEAAVSTRYLVDPIVEDPQLRNNVSSHYLPLYAPPDRLALYHCFLI
jgi:hypothetical protein